MLYLKLFINFIMTTEYTNVVQLGSRLVNELKVFIENHNLVGTRDANYLIESFENFREMLADPLVSQELDNYKLKVQNPIEKYGVAEEVITLLEEGKSNPEIAEGLALRGLPIEAKHVLAFKREYKDADIISKIEKSNASVFDTQVQFQMIFDSLNSKLADLAHVDDERLANARVVREQLELEYTRELRMTIKDAQALAEAMLNMENNKKIITIMLDTVNKMCGPTVFNQVASEVRKQKLIFGSGL
jgi:hypothetical protein